MVSIEGKVCSNCKVYLSAVNGGEGNCSSHSGVWLCAVLRGCVMIMSKSEF